MTCICWRLCLAEIEFRRLPISMFTSCEYLNFLFDFFFLRRLSVSVTVLSVERQFQFSGFDRLRKSICSIVHFASSRVQHRIPIEWKQNKKTTPERLFARVWRYGIPQSPTNRIVAFRLLESISLLTWHCSLTSSLVTSSDFSSDLCEFICASIFVIFDLFNEVKRNSIDARSFAEKCIHSFLFFLAIDKFVIAQTERTKPDAEQTHRPNTVDNGDDQEF